MPTVAYIKESIRFKSTLVGKDGKKDVGESQIDDKTEFISSYCAEGKYNNGGLSEDHLWDVQAVDVQLFKEWVEHFTKGNRKCFKSNIYPCVMGLKLCFSMTALTYYEKSIISGVTRLSLKL